MISIKYLSKIPLFANFTQDDLEYIDNSKILVSFPKDAIIINEGELSDEFYIILEGSVQVFTMSQEGTITILARLDEKDYFGEQAYLNNLIRTASVKAQTDVQLIKINYKILDKVFKRSDNFRKFLEKTSIDQSIANLQSQVKSINSYLRKIFCRPSYFTMIRNFFSKNKITDNDTLVKKFKKNDLIFKKGDEFDYVYLILSGSVSLIFEENNSSNEIIISKNNIFGELGILQNAPRQATAMAFEDTKLIAITGEGFLSAIKKHKGLKSLSVALRNIYSISNNDAVVNQYMGKFQGEEAVFSVYNLKDGSSAICAKVVNQSIFTIEISDCQPDESFEFAKGDLIKRIIKFKNGKIVGLVVFGEWEETSILCDMLIKGIKIHHFSEELFLKTGMVVQLSSNSSYYQNNLICNCMQVSYDNVKDEIKRGNNELGKISQATGACSVCGSCRDKILDILGNSIWISATIQLNYQYSDNVFSFIIKPLRENFNEYQPGQYISLKLQINGLWITRVYTLVFSSKNDKHYEIIIKKYPHGVFSQWLYEHREEHSFIWVSRPAGKFVLPADDNKKILCFAGGIGITPFLSFLGTKKQQECNHSFYIFYAAQDKKSAFLPEKINDFLNNSPQDHLEIWDTESNGLITEEIVGDRVDKFMPDYVYICGIQGFEKLIVSCLKNNNFDVEKIITEEFVSAG